MIPSEQNSPFSKETEPNRSARPIAIGGFMGVGKTSVGRELANQMSLPFLDTDEVLESRFGSVIDQFDVSGESVFREREARLVSELTDGKSRVLSTGGGVFADPSLVSLLSTTYDCVLLRASWAVVWQRIRSSGRPLLDSAEMRFREREQRYLRVPLQVECDGKSVQQIVAEVLCLINA